MTANHQQIALFVKQLAVRNVPGVSFGDMDQDEGVRTFILREPQQS
jgi:hypothetical protein